MDRCALFVDAGYLLADGAMAVHGTRHRETVSWDFGGLLQLLGNLARERTGMPLLRCYWYEATVEGRRSPEHEALADLPGLKLRLGRIRPGRREGVDTEIHRDLGTLARNGALADAVVVSGDEDLAQVVADAQDLGVRVTVVHVAVDGNWTISRVLRQECDDLIEIGSGHLRPYVNLLAGVESASGSSSLPALTASSSSSSASSSPPSLGTGSGTGSGAPSIHPVLATSPLSNGHGTTNPLGPLQTTAHNGPPPASPLSGRPPVSPASPVPPITPPPSPAPTPSPIRDLGPAMTAGTGMSTGPVPLPGGALGSSFGNGAATGATPSPLQPSPLQPPPLQSPPLQPAPTSASSTAPTPLPPSIGPQYGSPIPAPSPPPPPQTLPSNQSQPLPLPATQPHGPYTSPQQISPVPAQQNTPTLADAVKAAHQEGQDFGESVARDAPALWLEAVLARKPRMPSDLEARLLQGSSLPIDFLLHDEVRHALRRGFWDALERSRR
ncbi:NYN domain-containing protein [Actinomadura roseirufa]|uniref:NYN domain-containing protein n=1 Tax=Actinomadura roseirufa TaxID=2094049 RepID=UPI0010412E86|nr:NYN domain-containing protein [Actinomadura roseirufa]